MWKKVFAALVISAIGYSFYGYYTGPFYDAPTIASDDFLLAFNGEGGLKGVMIGFGEKDRARKYMSYQANDVPKWYKDTWSTCRTPKIDEATEFNANVNIGPGGRLDAVCEINADGDVFIRGWIVTVPNL